MQTNQNITLDSFHIIGIEVRTKNENGQSQKDIGALWQKFYSENVLDNIPNKVDDEILGLYTDYEKDFTKPYTMVIGCRVKNLENVPEGMVGKTINQTDYVVIPVKGELPKAILQTWQEIWKSDIPRAYKADFEIYKENSEVDIYLSISNS